VAVQPTEAAIPDRPRLRGVLHQWAFVASLAAGGALVAGAAGARAHVSAVVFACTVASMFGASALYHRVSWEPRPRRWLRRLDHAMIYGLIAGTYTPFGLVALSGAWRVTILAIVWTGALVAIVLKLVWVDGPKWVSAGFALGLGWVGIVGFPKIVGEVGWTSAALLLAGGVLYSVGAIVYVLRRPDPLPHTFGYHEVFHAFVIGAVALQYGGVALIVLD
jgi:hemolysin III